MKKGIPFLGHHTRITLFVGTVTQWIYFWLWSCEAGTVVLEN